MRAADAVLSRLVLIRVVPGLVILLYLFVAAALPDLTRPR